MLARNGSCRETLSFLGGGCWQHYVPAVVDEVINRGEFLTAYYGEMLRRITASCRPSSSTRA